MQNPSPSDPIVPVATWRRGRIGRTVALSSVAAAGLVVAACGGSSGASSTPTTTTPAVRTPTTLPGASGTIAAVAGTTLQVQNPTTGQTAVTYTPSTTIRQITTTSASSVVVGSCISAFGKPATTSTTGSPFGEPITATTVSISQPTNGTCSRGGLGGRPGGTPGTGSRPAGGFGGFGGTSGTGTRPGGGIAGAFGAASGLVTAVSGSTVSVTETNLRTQGRSSVTVTLTGATTYTTTQPASAAAIVVGQCARAIGSAGTTGAVTATSLTVSAPTNGTCTSGFGFRGGFGGAGAPAGASTGA